MTPKSAFLTSFNFAYFQGSSQVILSIGKGKLITILLLSNWPNRHGIRVLKKRKKKKECQIL